VIPFHGNIATYVRNVDVLFEVGTDERSADTDASGATKRRLGDIQHIQIPESVRVPRADRQVGELSVGILFNIEMQMS